MRDKIVIAKHFHVTQKINLPQEVKQYLYFGFFFHFLFFICVNIYQPQFICPVTCRPACVFMCAAAVGIEG